MKLFPHLAIAALFCLCQPVATGVEIESVAGTGEPGFSGDGAHADLARINNPFGVELGPGGELYFCDTGNHVIRKIDRGTGVITTVAGTGGERGYSGGRGFRDGLSCRGAAAAAAVG